MREFIIFARRAVTSPNFNLNDLPSSGGRMDLVARCVSSALWLSRAVRRDTKVYVVINGPPEPPMTVLFDGQFVQKVSPDERNIASWIQKAISLVYKKKTKEWLTLQKGIKTSKKSFQEIIRENKDRNFYVLHEKGKDIRDIEIKQNPIFVIGDHIGLPKREEDYMKNKSEKISLGKKSYLASHCIILLHNKLDRKWNH